MKKLLLLLCAICLVALASQSASACGKAKARRAARSCSGGFASARFSGRVSGFSSQRVVSRSRCPGGRCP